MSVRLLEPDVLEKYRELVGTTSLAAHLSAEAQRALFVHIDGLSALLQKEREAVERQAETIRSMQKRASTFVDFVLRHTWPERATAHGAEAVHSIIKHHPFAQEAHANGLS